MRRFGILLLLLACTLSAQALSLEAQSDLELAATADIIVVGSVTAVSSVREKEDYMAGAGCASIHIERVIAGSPEKTLDIHFPTPPRKHGMAWGLTLKKGEKKLFILQFAGNGYYVQSPQGIQPADAADRFAQLVKEMPVHITLVPPGPLTVEKPVTVSVKITNLGEKPLELREMSLIACAVIPARSNASATPAYINFSPQQPKLTPEEPGLRIEPGETKTVTAVFTPEEPQQPVQPARPQAIICRASVWLKIIDPQAAKAPPSRENLPITQGFYASSPWQAAELSRK